MPEREIFSDYSYVLSGNVTEGNLSQVKALTAKLKELSRNVHVVFLNAQGESLLPPPRSEGTSVEKREKLDDNKWLAWAIGVEDASDCDIAAGMSDRQFAQFTTGEMGAGGQVE